MYNIGFIGLGKLGHPVAKCIAAQGHRVYGVDPAGFETYEDIQLYQVEKILALSLVDLDFIFIAVPTPNEERFDGRRPAPPNEAEDFDYSIVCSVVAELNIALMNALKHSSDKRRMPTVVLISTCLPGTVRRDIAPLLTVATLIYNPYFIAMGTVEEDYKNPEFLAIGNEEGYQEWHANQLIKFYQDTTNCERFEVATWEEAEAMKIFYNTFITFKLCFVNMIQDVSMKVGHMNTDVVTEALAKSDQRLISSAYMKAGMGDGGPCHPRDNIALRWLAHSYELGYDMFGTLVTTREKQAHNLATFIGSVASSAGIEKIVIIGKSFKPGTDLEDGSYTVLLQGYLALVHDVSFAEDMGKDAFDDKAIYVIGHRDDWDYDYPDDSIVIDPWRTMPKTPPGSIGYPHPPQTITVIHYGNTRPDS